MDSGQNKCRGPDTPDIPDPLPAGSQGRENTAEGPVQPQGASGPVLRR